MCCDEISCAFVLKSFCSFFSSDTHAILKLQSINITNLALCAFVKQPILSALCALFKPLLTTSILHHHTSVTKQEMYQHDRSSKLYSVTAVNNLSTVH